MISYLERLRKEYQKEQLEIEKELENLQIHQKENTEFIKLLENNIDPNIESFSPRDVNAKDKAKIAELQENQKKLEQEILDTKERYARCIDKVEEISNVIADAKQEMVQENKSDDDNERYRLTLLETQENERQRISRELHDSTVQNLTSLVHKAELCSKLVEMDPIRCKLELNMMSRTLREIINETRDMIYNLRPMSFDDIGLDVTIKRALEKLETSESKKISFTVEGESCQIKPVIGITLLRIIQEACNNSIKYANASLIQVLLRYETDQIYVSIEDDGCGFDTENNDIKSRKDNSGFGLSMMRERVYLLSGNINIDSKINHGTKIVVNVPIME
jgi:two-component system sensor histidine kinase DegS